MSKFPSLPLFTDAFIADTGHLTAQETGAYLMLLMMAWRLGDDCSLPDDDQKLAKWARVDGRTWNRIKPTVMSFWNYDAGFWTQKRLQKERTQVCKRAEVARVNGMYGGRPKPLKNKELQNPAANPTQTQKKAPNPNPIYKNMYDEKFEEFWEAKPNRKGGNPKAPACKAFLRAVKAGADADAIIAGAKKWAAEEKQKSTQPTEYVPMAATWLNQERWGDYPPEPDAVVIDMPGIFVRCDSPQWDAWCRHYREKGLMPPFASGRENGRRFESEWPPGFQPANQRAS